MVSVRIPDQDLKKVQALASIDRTSVGEQIRIAVKEYLERRLSDPQIEEKVEKARQAYIKMLESLSDKPMVVLSVKRITGNE